MNKDKKWEVVVDERRAWTKRLKVDGGHLYRICFQSPDDSFGVAMSFVPDVDLTRYQAHLRDAYKQGYMDGQLEARNPILDRTDIP